MIKSVQLIKPGASEEEIYCCLLQAGKNILVAEGSGEDGKETLRTAYETEAEAINEFCKHIMRLQSEGYVLKSQSAPFEGICDKELPLFQDWNALSNVISVDEAEQVSSKWNWDHFFPLRDTLELRRFLMKLEEKNGILPLHHLCTAEIVRRFGTLMHNRAHQEGIESRSLNGKHSAFVSGIINKDEGGGQISIWENETNMIVNYFSNYGGSREYLVQFSPDGELLACSKGLNAIELHYPFESGYNAFAEYYLTDGWTTPPSVEWSPDSNALLLGMYEAALVEFTKLFKFEPLVRRFFCHGSREDMRWFTVDIEKTKKEMPKELDDDEEEQDEDEDIEFPEVKYWKFKEVKEEEIGGLWEEEEYDEVISEITPEDHRWEELPDEVKAQFVATSPEAVKPNEELSDPFSWNDDAKDFDRKKSPMIYGKSDDLNRNYFYPAAFPSGKKKYQWSIVLPSGLIMSPLGLSELAEEVNFSIASRYGWPLRWADERSVQVTKSLAEFAAHPKLLKEDIHREDLEEWAKVHNVKLAGEVGGSF